METEETKPTECQSDEPQTEAHTTRPAETAVPKAEEPETLTDAELGAFKTLTDAEIDAFDEPARATFSGKLKAALEKQQAAYDPAEEPDPPAGSEAAKERIRDAIRQGK